jgi:hypothetical protein
MKTANNFKNNISMSSMHPTMIKATNKELIDVLLHNSAKINTPTEFNESPSNLALQNELLNKGNIDFYFLKTD